jgi:hypothetical protein
MSATLFTIRLLEKEGKIVLAGTLDDSREAATVCARALRDAAARSQWYIDATQVLLPRGGVKTWLGAVSEFLGRCQLIYLPSQLSWVLQQLPEDYQHPDSKFLPEEAFGMTASWVSPRPAVAH